MRLLYVLTILLAAALPAQAQAPAQAPATPGQDSAKYEADLAAFNDLRATHDLLDDFDTYLARAEHWLPPDAKPGDDTIFRFDLRPFDPSIQALQAALALPGSVPDLDRPATALLEALQRVNPPVKAMQRYATTRGYRSDDYRFARATHPALVAAMQDVIKATATLEAALGIHATMLDQAKLDTLPQGSLPRLLLADRLALRRVEPLLRNLQAGADTAPLAAPLQALAAANDALSAALDAASPPTQGTCTSYMRLADDLLGYARDKVAKAKNGEDPTQPIDGFRDTYPITVDTLDKCQQYEPRARP